MHVIVEERICKRCKTPQVRYRLSTSRVCLKCHNRHKVRYARNRPQHQMLILARHRAKRDSVPFAITLADFEIPEYCPVFGMKLERGRGLGKSRPCSPTLDRIIPALGYVPGNVVVISRRANQIKNDASLEDLKNIVSWLEGVLTPESMSV